MPRTIHGIKIFVGSPGGLDSLRKEFRKIVDQYNRLEALPVDVHFEAVGWEDTLPTGLRRGQAVINAELRSCDYALFLLRDRWGTPLTKLERRRLTLPVPKRSMPWRVNASRRNPCLIALSFFFLLRIPS